MLRQKRLAVAVSIALTLSAWSAHAVLERVGPVSNAPSIGGYPLWYQDTSGLALEFCDPKNAAELDGGWCLLLPGDVEQVPESFPTNFFDEHFWFAADAGMTPATGGKAALVLAVEAAFAADVVPGGQVAFSRIRLLLNPVPVTGEYRFIHPYGEKTIFAQAGERIFFTDDVGITCAPGDFSCATQSELGPFLLPSNEPGGAELPAVPGPVPGKLYIADPARSGPVTGSKQPPFVDSLGRLRDHNVFRIEGPAGSRLGGPGEDAIETSDFTLMGRVYTGALPSRIAVDRASYSRDGNGIKLDVFANAFETTQGRLPAQPRPAPIEPQLAFYGAPCGGSGIDPDTGELLPPFKAPVGPELPTQMFATAPGLHWGQIQPAALPVEVCVKDGAARDANGNISPVFIRHRVTDEVSVIAASYDAASATLTVQASSSDQVAPPTLTAAFGTFREPLAGGQIMVTELLAPPPTVRVLSSAGDSASAPVRTSRLAGAPTPIGLPVAVNDAYTLEEDAPPQLLNVLENDANSDGGQVTLKSLPRLGTATVEPGGYVAFTPHPDRNGTDQFTYTVTKDGKESNTASVTLTITPVNDVPVAVNDSFAAIANVPGVLAVLGNDQDPDGAGDLLAPTNLTQPVLAGQTEPSPAASVAIDGAGVRFVATAPGTYNFTYQAMDRAEAVSENVASVTVQVAAAETVNFTRAEYVQSKGRLRAQGTVSPAANQGVTVHFLNGTGVELGLAGTTVADAAGNWDLDAVVARPAGATSLRATSSNGATRVTTLSLK